MRRFAPGTHHSWCSNGMRVSTTIRLPTAQGRVGLTCLRQVRTGWRARTHRLLAWQEDAGLLIVRTATPFTAQMFSPELYQPLYQHGMLALVIFTAIVYLQGGHAGGFSAGFNAFMIWAVGGLTVLFLGTRPIDSTFVDMTTYASSFRITQGTGKDFFSDWGFNLFNSFFAGFTTEEVFFLACAAVYVVPLMFAMRRIHGPWAYAAFLAFAGGFSFYTYGVNGIRNGMSTSLLIAAFAFWDRKLLMVLLMVAAEGMHKSALLPIVAFLVAGFYSQPWLYGAIWAGALGMSAFAGESLSNVLIGMTALGDDERLASYTSGAGFGADKGGFRPDFVLYSIVPVIIAWVLAGPAVKKDRFYRRMVCTYLLANSFWLVVMYAAFSNRFAYLSWFMMPWIVIYPFVPRVETPGKVQSGPQEEPRISLLGAALVAHFAFTYIMAIFVYSIGRRG